MKNQQIIMSGFDKKSRVLVNLPNSYALADVIRYCFDNNLTVIPVDPNLPNSTILHIIDHSEANYVIDSTGIRMVSGKIQTEKDIFLITYTSGSTGDPKGVMLSRDAVIDNAKKVGKLHGFDIGKKHATCLPLYHCNAICMSLIGTHLYGFDFSILSKFNATDYTNLIKKDNITTASIAPALLVEIIENDIVLPDCLEYLITAAAPLTSDMASKFFKQNGPRLVQGYGLSEAVNFSFVMPKLNSEEFVKQYINQHPPVGLPLEGTDVRLVDGEIQVRGPNLMKGYLKNSKKTDEVMTSDGFLKTGDIGSYRDGFLVIQGRIKDVINRGGETIYPKDIEDFWTESGINNCVAFAVENNVMGDEIGIWSETHKCSELTKQSALLKKYIPATVQTGKISRTSVGKVQRKKMSNINTSSNISIEKIDNLIARIAVLAQNIISYNPAKIPSDTSGFYIHNEAKNYLDKYNTTNLKSISTDAVFESIKAMEDNLDEILYTQKTGSALMKENKGMWRELMNGFPMDSYAKLCTEFLIKRNLLGGKVLELGAGVGNASNLITDHISETYIRSNYAGDLNKRYGKGDYMTIDFNQKLPVENIDTIFAVNALHCAENKESTISNIYDALGTNGVFVLSEGQKNPYKDYPWILNTFYGMFSGWWDKGGFLNRIEWIEIMENAGFTNIGWSKIRAGRYDLGGIIWGEKK